MFKKLRIKVDHKNKTITIKRGLFGVRSVYSGGFWDSYSIKEIIEDFESAE